MERRADDGDGGLVRPGDGCPRCGERRVDQLLWNDDDTVRCATCGTVYDPLHPDQQT